jgi:hypothetical protein
MGDESEGGRQNHLIAVPQPLEIPVECIILSPILFYLSL